MYGPSVGAGGGCGWMYFTNVQNDLTNSPSFVRNTTLFYHFSDKPNSKTKFWFKNGEHSCHKRFQSQAFFLSGVKQKLQHLFILYRIIPSSKSIHTQQILNTKSTMNVLPTVRLGNTSYNESLTLVLCYDFYLGSVIFSFSSSCVYNFCRIKFSSSLWWRWYSSGECGGEVCVMSDWYYYHTNSLLALHLLKLG